MNSFFSHLNGHKFLLNGDFMTDTYCDCYDNFKCVADKCSDSCCKDWDIVIDSETNKFYKNIKGSFGRRLSANITVDEDGDTIFISDNGKCPFWNDKMLCDIFINLGEEHLCSTCKKFPRLTQDYTCFSEHLLSFACPEAARLMLSQPNVFESFRKAEYSLSQANYNINKMYFLLSARSRTAEIFTNKTKPFSTRLKQALIYNNKVQDIINSEEYTVKNIELPIINEKQKSISPKFIIELHQSLDIVSSEWRNILDNALSICEKIGLSNEYDNDFEVLALYYIYRYYLTAIADGNVLNTIKRIFCAYTVIYAAENYFKNYGELNFDTRVMLMQRYSKEVEHSYENSEALEFEFYTNPDFSADNLIIPAQPNN